MASLFTTTKNMKSKIPFGGQISTPFYLQFVPGVCVDPITTANSFNGYGEDININSIMAISHIRDGEPKKKRTNMTDDDRYFPLFRGMFEVPTKGDPVLLCTIGGIQYYLGPLNTDNNPNFNEDNLWEPEIPLRSDPKFVEVNPRIIKGESLNFKKKDFQRLTKDPNKNLDNGTIYGETHGDMMLEGRHGNSIRIGSRDINPYIFISNGRDGNFTKEGFADGTLISITKSGTLNQHFGGYAKQIKSDNLDDIEYITGFILASDYTSTNEAQSNRMMGDLVKSVNGGTDPNQQIYGYGKLDNQNQILASSDRITINSKSDDIYLSSNNDIHIGTKRHLTISTNKKLIIESETVNLGNPNKKTMEGMVLGEELKTVLKSIVNLLSEVKSISMLGTLPLVPSPNLAKVITDIDKIVSNKHKLETN
tara:strand:- start:9 stop:1274 length:1266 start_codon:yes stop_codon:yes gene_type:complete